MESELQQAEYTQSNSPEAVAATEVKVSEPTTSLAKLPPAKSSDQWQRIGEQVSAFLAQLPDYLGKFFSDYRQPLTSLGLILGAIITVKVVLAVLDALNDIPLLAPTFQLIGISYSAWFVYRYLLKAENRQELSQEFDALKHQVMGKSLPEA
jgi:hypothetical protein